MYTSDRREEDGEHGPIYTAIERALWALGPALLIGIRARAEQRVRDEVASQF